MTDRRRSGDSRSAHGPSGVTIVELIIAMMLIVVLAGIAMPYIDVAGFQVRGAAQSVGTTLLAAQRLAVKEQHDIVVAVDADGRVLRLHEDENNDGVRDEGERVRHVALGDGVVFGRGGAPARAMGAAAVELDGRQDGLPAITFPASSRTTATPCSRTATRPRTRPTSLSRAFAGTRMSARPARPARPPDSTARSATSSWSRRTPTETA